MNLTYLGSKQNISSSRNSSKNPSMQLDSRGFPCISWFETKNGNNQVNYMFWDGIQWAYVDQISVYKAKYLIYSKNSLILKNDKPILAFCSKYKNNNKIHIAYTENNNWILNNLEVNYDIEWVGISEIKNILDTENSSSSSSSSTEVEESSSSTSSSSSSSSIDSSSSDSLDSSSSSSSSSEDDAEIVIFVYDGQNILAYSNSLNIYKLLSSKNFPSIDIESLKIHECGNKICFVYKESQIIKYNFFDTISNSWDFNSFQSLNFSSTSGNIIDFDIYGNYSEYTDTVYISWLENLTNTFEINYATFSNENEISQETIQVNNKNTNTNSYINNGFLKTAIHFDNNLPNIIVTGAETLLFSKNISGNWSSEILNINIEGIFNPSSIILREYSDNIKVCIENLENDIYYLEETTGSISVSRPNMCFLNAERFYISQFKNGELDGEEILETYTNRSGDILKESKIKTAVVIDDNEDPDFYSSSSSSSLEYSSESSSESSEEYSESSSSSS